MNIVDSFSTIFVTNDETVNTVYGKILPVTKGMEIWLTVNSNGSEAKRKFEVVDVSELDLYYSVEGKSTSVTLVVNVKDVEY